jgi:lysophospholipase L1-like esterase
MSTLFNGVANSNTTNIVPVQGTFDQYGNNINLIGPGGKPFTTGLPNSAILALDSNSNPIGILNQTNGTLLAYFKNTLKYYLPNFNLKLLQVIGNSASANFKIAFMGDSTTAASYSDGTQAGLLAQAIPQQVANLLNNTGLLSGYVNKHVWWGNGFNGSSIPTYDPRWTLNTGWASASLGGNTSISSTSANINAAVFQPALDSGETYDTVDIYYIKNNFAPSVTVTIGGIPQGTVLNGSGTSSTLIKQTYSVTATSGAVSMAKTTPDATRFDILGVVCYKSNKKQIDVYNYGSSGKKVGDFSSASAYAWGLYNALWDSIIPDLTVINLTINDTLQSTAIATYTSQLQAIITKAKSVGECILMTGLPQSSTYSTQQSLIYQAVRDLAASNNVLIIDIGYRWVNQTISSNFYAADFVHGNAAGYADVARAITNVINDSN